MLLFDMLGDKMQDLYSWAAQYAPQWLLKAITALIIIDMWVGAFSI